MRYRCTAAAVLALGAGAGWGEIIDRIVATVGTSVVTQSDVVIHLRVRAFLDSDTLDLSLRQQRQAVDRLVDQALIRREVEISRYTPPDMADVDSMLQEIRRPAMASDADYARALAKYGITDDQLRQALLWQLTLLRFISYRFRPGIQVPDSDVRAWYEKELVAKARSEGKEPPSFEDTREEIEKILTNQRVDEAMNRWLEQARSQVQCQIREEVFQ